MFAEKMFGENLSAKNLSAKEIEIFQKEIGNMGYKFQFVTLAGFHAQNHAIFDLAKRYKKEGMSAYSELQKKELEVLKLQQEINQLRQLSFEN